MFTPSFSRQTHQTNFLGITFLSLLFSLQVAAQVAVTTYHNDNSRTGQNLQEVALTTANVNVNSFGKLFSYDLPGGSYAYAQPLYLPNVTIPSYGVRNVVYVATERDIVYAFDADGNAPGQLWGADLAQRVGGTPPTTYPPSTADLPHAEFIGPTVGITSTPVIDRDGGTLYVVTKTKEAGQIKERLHAIDVLTGAPRFGGNGSVEIQASVPGTGSGSSNGVVGFDPKTANQRPGLLLANNVVYIAWGAYQDTPHYHGWVMAYDATTLQQLAVFNTTPNGGNLQCQYLEPECDGKGGGIWTNGALASDATGDVYAGSGNGTFDSNNDYGETFLRLRGVTLGYVDSFTPYNANYLDSFDLDVAGGLLMPPDQGGGFPHILISAGKEGRIYVLNRDDMGGFTPSGPDRVIQAIQNAVGGTGCGAIASDGCNRTTPAYWQNAAGHKYVYFHGQEDVVKAFELSGSMLSLNPVSQGSIVFPNRGASPAVSSNNEFDGIVWELRVDDPSNSGGPAVLYAYDANDLSRELYDSNQNFSRDNPGQAQNFIVPTIANGKVYVATRATVSVYGLLNPTP